MPDHPNATSVEFHFGGSNVETFDCQLDEQPIQRNCTSPFPLTMLAAGNHTFMISPTAGAGERALV